MAQGGTAPTSSCSTSSPTRTRQHHPPRPPWRAPTCALPDPGADPTIYVANYEHYDDAPRGSLPPIGYLPDSWGPVTPMNHNNYRTIVVTLTTRLSIAWLVGDAEWAMGIARRAHGGEWGEFLHRSGAMTPGATESLMAAYLTWRGIAPRMQPLATGTACPAAARSATATGLVWQCGSGQDDGQRYPARRPILLLPENRDHHHPPAPIPRHDSD